MTVRFHLFPFRTQKLSSLVPKIVGWRRPVKIGRCRLLFLYGPLVKRLRQRPLTPLTWVRFPHGSPKNTPAYAGVFFRVSRARNRTGQCAAAHKKQSSGLFFSPREIPACVTRNTPAYAGVFFRVSVRGIEPDGAQVLLCAIMERCVFGCILDMKIPPELSEFFLCLL